MHAFLLQFVYKITLPSLTYTMSSVCHQIMWTENQHSMEGEGKEGRIMAKIYIWRWNLRKTVTVSQWCCQDCSSYITSNIIIYSESDTVVSWAMFIMTINIDNDSHCFKADSRSRDAKCKLTAVITIPTITKILFD